VKFRIAIIGTGNVAYNLANAIKNEHDLIQIYGRDSKKAQLLADITSCMAISELQDLDTTLDLVIIAVTDNAVGDIALQLKDSDATFVHTAGSLDIDVLSKFKSHGVLYALQTFNKENLINFQDIPVCIEANNSSTLNKLEEVARSISNNLQIITSTQRKHIHVAAVFTSNFSNHMITIAEDLIKQHGMDFSILQPLINETYSKLQTSSPGDVQTGPAKRNDQKVMSEHMELLNTSPEYQKIYTLVSESILNKHGR